MDLVGDLPTEKIANKPDGEARQPLTQTPMSPPIEKSQISEISSSSQCNSLYKDALSQPGPGLSQYQRLLWLQKRHKTGLWAQCDACDRWRYLPHVLERSELPDKWYCKMNPDHSAADCSVPEKPIRLRDEEDLVHSEYSAGSVVLARFSGYPWWPAMVEDCPDTEQYYWLDGFSDIPTYYNVVFFDSHEVTRSWIAPKNLKPYNSNRPMNYANKDKRYKKRLDVAYKQADDADMLPLADRLAKYSFLKRYKGSIGEPKEITKQELLKFKNKLKRKFNIDFSDDSSSESDETDKSDRNVTSKSRKQAMKNKNVILLGTPSKKKSYNNLPKKVRYDDTEPIQHKDAAIIVKSANPDDPGQLKQPNSLTVQFGSTTVNDTLMVDDDSSKIYLPDSQIDRRSMDPTQAESAIHVRIATPSSDDFDF